MGDLVVADVPSEVTLEDAIREGTTEFVNDRVETWFGGRRLPTAIKDGDEILAHLSDQISMQANLWDAIGRGDSGIL